MTTRAERIDHVREHQIRMLIEWSRKTGNSEAINATKDPRYAEAISLLVDVLGEIEEAGDDDMIEDVAFISEDEDEKG